MRDTLYASGVTVPLNYTLSDILGILVACTLYVPVLMAPGYVTAWLLNVLDFRSMAASWRMLLCVPLSAAICPILTYWLGTLGSWTAVWLFYSAAFIVWLALLVGLGSHPKPPVWIRQLATIPRVCWIVAAAWCAIALFSLVDLQLGDRLYFSSTAHDHEMRVAVTETITREGAHPSNPLYLITGSVPLRYHYFWFLLCSQVERMGGPLVGARLAIFGSVVWCGWALLATLPLFFRYVLGRTGEQLQRTSTIAACLLAVTGLDLIPTLVLWFQRHDLFVDMEWWNADQVTSWFDSLLWVPHHIAALVAGLTGFLVITWGGNSRHTRDRGAAAILGGLAFATAVGTSVYVALALAFFLCAWAVALWVKGERHSVAPLIAAGAVATFLAAPFLLSLVGPGSGGPFLKWTIRRFSPLDDWLGPRNIKGVLYSVLQLLALPLNLLVEFGFFLVAGVAYLRRLRGSRPSMRTVSIVVLAAASLLVSTFLRSRVVANDLNWRAILPAQFVLLLWAADMLANQSFSRRFFRFCCVPLLVIGAGGTVYQLVILRVHGMLEDAGVVQPYSTVDRQLGGRTLAFHKAFDQLDALLPRSAVVQGNPNARGFDVVFQGLYSHRRSAARHDLCGTGAGGQIEACEAVLPALTEIFEGGSGMRPTDVVSLCRRLSIDAIVLQDLDGVWRDPGGWAQQKTPAIVNQHVRVYLVKQLE